MGSVGLWPAAHWVREEMAANLTPQYLEAEERFKGAQTADERLAALEEMFRLLPKHKASEKMQAELKKKISAARKDVAHAAAHAKAGAKVDPFHTPKSGAGQLVLLGTPNVGKSSLVAAVSHAPVKVAEYPFATALPVPGMVAYEDVQIQLVDTPPITSDHVAAGFPGLWHACDALLVVVDASADSLLDDADICLRHLAERHLALPAAGGVAEVAGELRTKPGLILANKRDAPGAADRLAALGELFGARARIEAISAHDASDMARFPRLLFDLLGIIRVYAKPPGKKADDSAPFILPAGSDVHALAAHVHRGMAQHLHSARIWGTSVFPGQNVQLDHVLHDKDIVELHA